MLSWQSSYSLRSKAEEKQIGKDTHIIAHLCHFIVFHAQDILHQVVGLTNQLHVSIFDPIVYHLYKVPGAFISHLPKT